jgi:extracellular elastinolytic metalloproteinase
MNVTGNTTTLYTTAGNNVIAHEDWEGQNNYITNYRPLNDSMVFVYDYGEPDGLAPKEYIDFVVTQLFYTSNMYHDLMYRLGFDEPSGNFQAYNHGRGGKGGDPVIANAQDGSGYNNANFMTPPDGQSGRMRMYVWDTATPFRDGDVEAGIVIHELSHGLSTRLTGGPANSGCLGIGEAGGMGEGWGDALATLIRQIIEHKSFVNGTDLFSMGSWAANREIGIRNYQYSTNATVNPSTYKILDKPQYWGVHAIGEVWAEFLFVMSARLVEQYGFSTTLFPPLNVSAPNDYYTQTLQESVDVVGRPSHLYPSTATHLPSSSL